MHFSASKCCGARASMHLQQSLRLVVAFKLDTATASGFCSKIREFPAPARRRARNWRNASSRAPFVCRIRLRLKWRSCVAGVQAQRPARNSPRPQQRAVRALRNTLPRAACAAALSGFSCQCAIEMGAGFAEIAALAEQGAQQIMRIGIARIELRAPRGILALRARGVARLLSLISILQPVICGAAKLVERQMRKRRSRKYARK